MKLSGSDRRLWQRLDAARNAMAEMHQSGIIDGDVVDAVDRRIERLAVLIRADSASVQLGGRKSTLLRDAIERLTDVMVQLIDAAVEHEAAVIDSEDVVPIRLSDLRDLLAARADGYREIRDI